jgi:hypothetical protein
MYTNSLTSNHFSRKEQKLGAPPPLQHRSLDTPIRAALLSVKLLHVGEEEARVGTCVVVVETPRERLTALCSLALSAA